MTLAEQQTATPPPVDHRPRWRRVAPTLLAGGGVALATVALHVHDPHQNGSWGKCPSLLFFGVYCPLCGGLRGVNDLTRFDFGGAASSNALTFVVLPLMAIWWALVLRDRWRGSTRSWVSYLPGGRWPTVLIAVALVFTVLRNVPFGAALAP